MRWWRKFFACENDDFAAETLAREHICDAGPINACERELGRLTIVYESRKGKIAELQRELYILDRQCVTDCKALSDLRLAIRSAAQSRTHKYSRDRGTGAIQARIATMPRLT